MLKYIVLITSACYMAYAIAAFVGIERERLRTRRTLRAMKDRGLL